MLHTIFRLVRPLILFDLETTSARSEEARIIELGMQVFTEAGMIREGRMLFNPGIPIPEEATAVHHITDEDVADKPKFIQYAKSIAHAFSNCDFTGKNIRFDLRVTAAEMKRSKVAWSYANANIICADRIEQVGEPRDLSTLYKRRCGKDLEGAHSALNDVQATGELIVAQLERWFPELPRDISLLHKKLWPDYVDCEGKFRWKSGEAVITFGQHNGKSIRQIPAGYLKWITEADFPDDVKRLAGEALQGRFPTP